MTNPFKFSGIVQADAFCNRQKQLADLVRAMKSGENLFLYSERRFGKTSLVKLALSKLHHKEFLSVYVDLWPTRGQSSFVGSYAKAMAESFNPTVDRMLDMAKMFFGRLQPSATIDEEGKPKIEFGVNKGQISLVTLDNVVETPLKIAAKSKKKIVVVFDEFQQIMEYEDDTVERHLRTAIQKHKDVSYIFLGSRKHLIQKLFLDKSRPLYRCGAHYPLPAISESDWIPFIESKFKQSNKTITKEQISYIYKQTEGHPLYTQHLCSVLWDIIDEGSVITEEKIEEAINILLDRESHAYSTLWELLQSSQRKLLAGLANEPAGVKPFSQEFITRYGFGRASSAQKAAQSLIDKDIIDREGSAFIITDRFFKIWIRRLIEHMPVLWDL